MEDVIKFAKENGFDKAEYLGEWNGFLVYEPLMKEEGVFYIGLPLKILQKGKTIRMSTADEAMMLNDIFIPEDDD